jgi:RecB family exonuclease
MKFTSFLAREIKTNNWLNEHLVIVLPSERASKYLMAELSMVYNKSIFAPQMITINELIKKHAPCPIIDPSRLLLALFNAYNNIEIKEHQSFEDFLSWGPMLLNDFEEIERYLLNPTQVFKNLKSIKELESWNLEGKELTEAQKKFMVFWDVLPELYNELQLLLAKKDRISAGKAYKKLAEDTGTLFGVDPEAFYLFAGFNALSTAELEIINNVIKSNKGAFYLDSDQYYFSNKQHEAGDFQRKNVETLTIGKASRIGDNIANKEMNISIVQCAQLTGQVKVASTELEKLSKKELDDTLVLLADETLISALIKNIPATVDKANITLGLPLNQTPIKSWVEIVFDIQENKNRFKTKAIYYKDLQRIINHVLFNSWLNESEQRQFTAIEQETIRYNKIFQNLSSLKITEEIRGILSCLLDDWEKDWNKAIGSIRKINALILSKLPLQNDFERNIVFVFDQSLLEFQTIVSEGLPDLSLRTFKLLFNQHWHSKSIAFHGNPIDGLQIMGLLETRLLDFKRIIILGMNEGNLPPTNAMNTIIPMDLRKGLGLPTMRHKQGIFAQHFYRLLHYCEELTLTYTTIGDQINAAEPSRYLKQLELELARLNPKAILHKSYYLTSFSSDDDVNANIVQKKPQIIEQLDAYFSKPVSASAINKYLKCPLDFYYRYIVEFGEEQTVMEDVESSDFGTFIHSTLEKLFTPFAQRDKDAQFITPPPKALTISDVDKMIVDFPVILRAEFMERFHNDATLFSTGKNLLSFEMANEIVLKTLLSEKEYIQTLDGPLYIEQVEAVMSITIPIQIDSVVKQIKLTGHIDRIDRVGDKYRILDYKTGKVESKHLEFNLKAAGIKAAFLEAKHTLQLTLYCMLFKEKYKLEANEASVFSLITSKGYTQELKNKNGTKEDLQAIFQELLQEVVSETYDLEIPFTHTEASKFCNYC